VKTRRISRRGYTLLELLCTLSLLGTFALIATRLFTSTFKVMWQTSQSSEVPMRFDAAISTLRSDLASAASVDVPDAHSMIVHDTAGKTIRWQCDGRHEISRHDSATQRNWDVGQSIEFHRVGAIVLIRPQDSADIAMAREEKQ
jgi:prepilin-type N-terminal cleavage/methylation domain-containing protein